MTIKAYHCLTGGDVEITDYVIEIDKIPIKSRNKDWSLVLPGMDFTVNKIGFTEGDRIRFDLDDVTIYAGYIVNIVTNYGNDTTDVELEHEVKYLLRGRIMRYRALSDLIFNFTDGALCTVTSGSDVVTKTNHGLTTGDWIFVKNQAGFIPDPAISSKYSWHYKVYRIDNDTFKIYECSYYTGTPAVTFVTFANTGAFSFKKATAGFSVDTTSTGKEFRLFTLSTFLGQIFLGMGLSLSASGITSYKFNAAGNTISTISVILNIMTIAGYNKLVNTDDIDNYSSVEDVLSEIFSALGLQLRCTADKEYTLHAAGRDSSGDIEHLTYTPGNDNAVSYSAERDIKESEGYKTYLSFVEDLDRYITNNGDDVAEYDAYEVLSYEEGSKAKDVSLMPNLVFFLGDASNFTSTTDRLSAVESTKLRIIDEYEDVLTQDYEFAYTDDSDVFEAKELSLDVENFRYKLTQEVLI